jgi:hypothetical protein
MFSAGKLMIVAAIAVLLTLAAAPAALAHDIGDGVPNHITGSVMACYDQGHGYSLVYWTDPEVWGATNGTEIVYYRPVIARFANAKWEYTYGAWEWTQVNPRGGDAGYFISGWHGGSSVYAWNGQTYYFGNQFYWPSINRYHLEWGPRFTCS